MSVDYASGYYDANHSASFYTPVKTAAVASARHFSRHLRQVGARDRQGSARGDRQNDSGIDTRGGYNSSGYKNVGPRPTTDASGNVGSSNWRSRGVEVGTTAGQSRGANSEWHNHHVEDGGINTGYQASALRSALYFFAWSTFRHTSSLGETVEATRNIM